jgi:acyl-CoA reductase-like NAD-dependent aldehyde dehydrogenase
MECLEWRFVFRKLFIVGQWSLGRPERIEVISPHTEHLIATMPDGTPGDMDWARTNLQKA